MNEGGILCLIGRFGNANSGKTREKSPIKIRIRRGGAQFHSGHLFLKGFDRFDRGLGLIDEFFPGRMQRAFGVCNAFGNHIPLAAFVGVGGMHLQIEAEVHRLSFNLVKHCDNISAFDKVGKPRLDHLKCGLVTEQRHQPIVHFHLVLSKGPDLGGILSGVVGNFENRPQSVDVPC